MLSWRTILAQRSVILSNRLAVFAHRCDCMTGDTAYSRLIRLTFRVTRSFLVLMMFVSLLYRLAPQAQTAEHAREVAPEPRGEADD